MAAKITLDSRLDALRDARTQGAGRIPKTELAAIDAVLEHASERRARSSEHTVVGFFGATGSGKSSLLNALVGEPLARTHVRRPTTSEPLAAVWRPEGADALLDWLQVSDRRLPAKRFVPDEELPLILLDLPDFDSVAAEHRAIAERLADQVDVLVWVVDPQKYADATLHREFIAPLAEHAAITAVVLNQIDLLPDADRKPVLRSLEQLTRADGLGRVEVVGASAKTDEGIDGVRRVIAGFARKRVAADARLAADARGAAQRLLVGFESDSDEVSRSAVPDAQLVSRIGDAAGVDTVVSAVGASYRQRAGKATGWPLTSWMLRFRPDPLRRLRLDHKREIPTDATGTSQPELQRSSLPPLSPARQAALATTVRDYADHTAGAVPPGWRPAVREQANTAIAELGDRVDRVFVTTDLGTRGSWWWPLIGVVQWIALLAALGGVSWYLAAWLLPLLGLPLVEITTVEGWPVPMLLIVFGLLLGIVLGTLSAAIAGFVSRRRAARARKRLLHELEPLVRDALIEPLTRERESAAAYRKALTAAAR